MSPFPLAAVRTLVVRKNHSVLLVIVLLVLLSLLLAGGFLLAFFWAVGTGQYDDEVTPSIRILFDDPPTDADDAR